MRQHLTCEGRSSAPSALPCPRSHPGSSLPWTPGISDASATGGEWDPSGRDQTPPVPSPNTAASQKKNRHGGFALAGLCQFTPLNSTAQVIYYFKLLPPSSRLFTASPTQNTAGGKPGTGTVWGFSGQFAILRFFSSISSCIITFRFVSFSFFFLFFFSS